MQAKLQAGGQIAQLHEKSSKQVAHEQQAVLDDLKREPGSASLSVFQHGQIGSHVPQPSSLQPAISASSDHSQSQSGTSGQFSQAPPQGYDNITATPSFAAPVQQQNAQQQQNLIANSQTAASTVSVASQAPQQQQQQLSQNQMQAMSSDSNIAARAE